MEQKEKLNKVAVKQGSSSEVPQPYKVRTKRRLPAGMKQRPRMEHRRGDRRGPKNEDGFETKVLSVRRVTNVKAGGKRMKLSVMVVVGDKKGRVGVATAKGSEVRTAQEKAIKRAKKKLITVATKGNTIPHEMVLKLGASKVFLKPAAPGTGVIAGATMRAIVELAGIQDVLTKVLGSNNHIAIAYCTIEALKKLRTSRL